ncbi:unnamed protein product, partial [Amoebophrya sp. A120]|eukprot:GSA120T00022357001.1
MSARQGDGARCVYLAPSVRPGRAFPWLPLHSLCFLVLTTRRSKRLLRRARAPWACGLVMYLLTPTK